MSEYKELLKHFGIKSELMVADMIDEEMAEPKVLLLGVIQSSRSKLCLRKKLKKEQENLKKVKL